MAISLKHAQAHRGPRPRRALRRQLRGRKKVSGTAERPRLVVTRSSQAHHRPGRRRPGRQDPGLRVAPWRPTCAPSSGDKTAKAKQVGELVAERAKAAGVEGVVFDRAGNKYHGRIAALADGAREGGLTF